MSIIATTAQQYITQINYPPLKIVLLKHLKCDANQHDELFSNHITQDREIQAISDDEFDDACALSILFRFAPTAVCNDSINLIVEADQPIQAALLTEKVILSVMFFSPISVRLNVCKVIQNWSKKNQLDLFFGIPSLDNGFKFLNIDDDLTAHQLMLILTNIEKKSLCQAIQRPQHRLTDYNGVIHFFKKMPEEILAVDCLELIDGLDKTLLQKLFIGSNSDKNLLHLGFEYSSEHVIKQLLRLFFQFNDNEKLSLLTQRASYHKQTIHGVGMIHYLTPLEVLFSNKNAGNIPSLMIKALAPHPALFALLTAVSFSRYESPLHLITRQHNTQALITYLELPGTSLAHPSFITKKTLLNLAEENGYNDIVTLNRALPFYRLIQQVDMPQAEKIHQLSLLEPTIQESAELLSITFSQDRTLLHCAVIADDSCTVDFLLKQGADPSIKDVHQANAVDCAIHHNQMNSLQLLASYSTTSLASLSNLGLPFMPFILQKRDSTLTKTVLTNLQMNPGEESIQCFISGLADFPIPKYSTQALEEALEKSSKNGTLTQLLSHYCIEQNDSLNLFLLHTAVLVSSSKHPAFINAAQHFIKHHLERLSNSTGLADKHSARLQVIIFLFAMPPIAMFSFLKTMTLSSLELTELDLILCQGLVKPLIFSRFTASEHQLILTLFTQTLECLQSIARIHFNHSSLTLLPPSLLQRLANVMKKGELYAHSQNRLNPAIMVLALQQDYAKKNPDPLKISELIKQLHHELALFNQASSPLSNDELRLMLSLITDPKIKQIINDFVPTAQNSIINQRIHELFLDLNKQDELPPQSLLRDAIKTFANTIVYHEPRYWPALSEWVSMGSVSEVLDLLSHHQKAIEPHCLTNHILSLAMAETTHQAPAFHLSQWLFSLDHCSARISLTVFVTLINEICNEMHELIGYLAEPSLINALNALGKTFNTLSDALIATQVAKTLPAWTNTLDLAFNAMQTAYHQASKALKFATIKSSRPLIHEKLIDLIDNRVGKSLTRSLKKAYQLLEERQQKQQTLVQQALSINPQLTSLNTIFTLEQDIEDNASLTAANHWYTDTLTKHFNQLNDSLICGIRANPHYQELFPLFLTWQMNNGYIFPSKPLFEALSTFIAIADPNTLTNMATQHNELLYLTKLLQPLLSQLQQLSQTSASINDLLTLFLHTKKETLQQLLVFTEKAKRYDLNRIIEYVLAAQEQQWPTFLLNVSDYYVNPIANWLKDSLNALSNYSSIALSINALLIGLYCNEQSCKTRLDALALFIQSNKIPLDPQAIILLAHSYFSVLDNAIFSDDSMAFVMRFSELLETCSVSIKKHIIGNLQSALVNLLLEHCLSGTGSDDPGRMAACKLLLTYLCQHTGSEAQLLVIKNRLGRQDVELLGDAELIAIANTVLNEKSTLDDLTMDGVWIQRLLTSPRFVAACTPSTLHHLTERYRALSLILKQDEFEHLNHFLTGKFSFAEQHRKAALTLQQELLANPERKAWLMAKRDRLLSFRADDSIRALFNQLEDNCFIEQLSNPDLADKAFNVLYTYHHQQLDGMRSDLLFRMANFIYSRAMRGKGDIPKAENSLLAWLERHLPHHNFQQAELERKSHVYLYNAEGKKIGYLDESNHAMTLVNDEPIPLLDTEGFEEGSVLYTNHRQRLGVLTTTGQLKQDNLFQRQTSALLVGKIPTAELEASPAALDLLMQDIFIENSINALFKNSEGQEKNEWLQREITHRFIAMDKPLTDEVLDSIVSVSSSDQLVQMLCNCNNIATAEQLFKAMLIDDKARNALFFQPESADFAKFLARTDTKKMLADFLIAHHHKPWFADGFQLFAQYSKKQGLSDLLSDALSNIGNRIVANEILDECGDKIMKTLIGSNRVAGIVLQGFLNDAGLKNIQESRTTHSNKVTQFFSKCHLMPAIESLNKQTAWLHKPQYRLLLTIFNAEYDRLFPSTELRLSEKRAWQNDDLLQISAFLRHHLVIKKNPDKEGKIGQRLLGELVFRTANFGQTSFFYLKPGMLDDNILKANLQRSTLSRLTARYYLVKAVVSGIEKIFTSIKNWFNTPAPIDDTTLKLLEENHAIIDWKALANESWAETNTTELPLLIAFLMNYSGATAPVSALMKDIFSAKAPCHLAHIAQLMANFPHRDISRVLFSELLAAVINNPALMDERLLTQLSTCYAHIFLRAKGASPSAYLGLLSYFGQQKFYGLTYQCAQQLLYQNIDSGYNKKLTLIATEAKIEGDLQNHLGKWYFTLWKSIKRWWHYEKKPSGIVKFVTDDTPFIHPDLLPNEIKTTTIGGQTITKELTFLKDFRQKKERYKAFAAKLSQTTTLIPNEPIVAALTQQGLFTQDTKALDALTPSNPSLQAVL